MRKIRTTQISRYAQGIILLFFTIHKIVRDININVCLRKNDKLLNKYQLKRRNKNVNIITY